MSSKIDASGSGSKIVVLIKQVPNMEEVKFDREEGRIDRGSAKTEA